MAYLCTPNGRKMRCKMVAVYDDIVPTAVAYRIFSFHPVKRLKGVKFRRKP